METYILKVTKSDGGFSVEESGNLSDFEIMGVLSHIQFEHSTKISKELAEYEQLSNTKG